jgi:hypothetical protein
MRFEAMIEQRAAQAREPGSPQLLPASWLSPALTAAPAPEASPDTGAGADRQWRPAPEADGTLLQDPDFELPTTAGPLRWSLFHDSSTAAATGPWGYGRRGSFPLNLTSDGTTVTVMHEDGLYHRYQRTSTATATYYPVGRTTANW